jgi:hypothetical protein
VPSTDPTPAADESGLAPPPRRRGWDVLTTLLVAAQVGSFWVVRHLPTQDGPVHLEIAAVLRRLLSGSSAVAAELFALNPSPEPNWLVHALFAELLAVVSPPVAEKIVLSGYALLAAAALVWALRGTRAEAAHLAPLALPLLFAFPFHMGFYNFCFGMALSLLVTGLWLRHAAAPRWTAAAGLGGLLLLTYLAHRVALAMSYGMVGTLAAAAALRARGTEAAAPATGSDNRSLSAARRCLLPPLLAALPSLALAAAYLGQDAGRGIERLPWRALARHLATGWSLVCYHALERGLALAWVAVVVTAAALTFARRADQLPSRAAAPLLVALAGALVAYLAAPVALAGGGYLNQRLQLYVFLLAVLLLGARAGARLRGVLRTLGATLAAGFLLVHVLAYRELEPLLSEYVAAGRAVPAGSTLLALSFDHRGAQGGEPSLKVQPFQHAAGWIGARHDVADLSLFQAAMGYFPIVYRPERDPYRHLGTMAALEGEEHDLDLAGYERATGVRIDNVLLWGRASAPASVQQAWERRLASYQLVRRSPSGRAEVYRRAGG